jgi:hypothetical protein
MQFPGLLGFRRAVLLESLDQIEPPWRTIDGRHLGDLHGQDLFDHYIHPQYYEPVKSADLEHWHDILAQGSFPKGAREGAVLKPSESIESKFQNLETNQNIKA